MTRRPAASAPPAALAALLAAFAHGALACMAAIQLLTSHRYSLTRTGFTTPFHPRLPKPAERGRRWRTSAGGPLPVPWPPGSCPAPAAKPRSCRSPAAWPPGLPVRLLAATRSPWAGRHANLTAVAVAIMAAGAGHHLP